MAAVFGIFLIIYGLIHLYYFVCSLQVSNSTLWLKWPGDSFFFTRFFGTEMNSIFASLFCLLSSIGLITSGILIFMNQSAWQVLMVNSALLSSFVFILFWDGDSFDIGRKGGMILLTDLALIVSVGFFHWPVLGF